MKPKLGRVVMVRNHGMGNTDAPAFVTNIWDYGEPEGARSVSVNLQLFADCAPPTCKTSVPMFNSRADAEAYLKTMVGHTPIVCFWPDRD